MTNDDMFPDALRSAPPALTAARLALSRALYDEVGAEAEYNEKGEEAKPALDAAWRETRAAAAEVERLELEALR